MFKYLSKIDRFPIKNEKNMSDKLGVIFSILILPTLLSILVWYSTMSYQNTALYINHKATASSTIDEYKVTMKISCNIPFCVTDDILNINNIPQTPICSEDNIIYETFNTKSFIVYAQSTKLDSSVIFSTGTQLFYIDIFISLNIDLICFVDNKKVDSFFDKYKYYLLNSRKISKFKDEKIETESVIDGMLEKSDTSNFYYDVSNSINIISRGYLIFLKQNYNDLFLNISNNIKNQLKDNYNTTCNLYYDAFCGDGNFINSGSFHSNNFFVFKFSDETRMTTEIYPNQSQIILYTITQLGSYFSLLSLKLGIIVNLLRNIKTKTSKTITILDKELTTISMEEKNETI